MKKLSKARILILVLSLALILGAVFCISAAAEETPEKGSFGSISIAHADKVAIRVEVNATVEELNNETVVVSYTLNGETKNAEYYMTDGEGRVWVITEGIAIYDLGQTVTFSSTVNGEVVESGRTYSVAQFLYKMLYVEEDIDEKDYNVYKYLLAYGEAAQIAHEKNLDKLVTASTVAFTNNANITINGMSSAFAPAASLEVTPKWNGHLDEGMSVDGWIIKDGEGQREVDSLTFTCTGVVEIIEPTLYVHTHTEAAPVVENNVDPTCTKDGSYDSVVYCSECGGEVRRTEVAVDAIGHDYSDVAYTWSADNTTCAAVQVCVNDASHTANEETAIVHQIALHVTADGVTYTYAVDFENYAAQTKTVEGDVAISDGLATVVAPTVAGRAASHEYVKFDLHDTNATHDFIIYYSEIDTWDGTSVSTEFVGEGTAENPYLISSGADLALLRERVNAGETYAGKYFKMTKSIDLNKVSLMIGKDYVAYGTEPTGGFAGIFDGNNCALLNIATKETEYNHLNGVFKAILTGGKVCNLSTYGELHQAINGTGVIAGNNFGTIENCTNYATISPAAGATISAIHRYSAGIVSVNNGSVISCVNYANVSGEEYACGIVSRMYKGTIENCINYGNMTGTGFREGGICGMADSGTIIGCVNYGDISGKSDVGGIVGTNKAVVSYCINYGSMVKGTGSLVGGIAGISYSAISNCINYGNVSAGSQYTGGIVGDMRANLSSCVNYGNITGTKEYAGGIIGGTSAALSDCENYGYIKGFDYAGGIVGYAKAAVSNCENHGEVSARQRVGGIAGSSTNNISKCINYSNVTGTADFVGGIVGASEGTTRTISGCVNNGAVKGVGYIGGIDGRPYTGTVTYDSCINNGTVTATYTSVDRGSAGGITGRSDSVMAILINCKSNGTVTAKSAGAYVGVHNASDTTGYVIYDSCSTILTGNAIGYDKTATSGIPLEGFQYTETKE